MFIIIMVMYRNKVIIYPLIAKFLQYTIVSVSRKVIDQQMREKFEILIKIIFSMVLLQLFMTVLYAERGVFSAADVMTVLYEGALSCVCMLGCCAFSEYILKNEEN